MSTLVRSSRCGAPSAASARARRRDRTARRRAAAACGAGACAGCRPARAQRVEDAVDARMIDRRRTSSTCRPAEVAAAASGGMTPITIARRRTRAGRRRGRARPPRPRRRSPPQRAEAQRDERADRREQQHESSVDPARRVAQREPVERRGDRRRLELGARHRRSSTGVRWTSRAPAPSRRPRRSCREPRRRRSCRARRRRSSAAGSALRAREVDERRPAGRLTSSPVLQPAAANAKLSRPLSLSAGMSPHHAVRRRARSRCTRASRGCT